MAETLGSVLPSARIAVILREPVARLESFHGFMQSILAIPRDTSLQTYVDRCLAMTDAELGCQALDMYRGVQDGRYIDYYAPWKQSFGDALQVFFFDDLATRPTYFWQDVTSWLGLRVAPLADLEQSVANPRAGYRLAALQRLALAANIKHERWFRAHPRAKQSLRAVYRRLNGATLEAAGSTALTDRLTAYYTPHNRAMGEALLRDQPHRPIPEWLRA